MPKKSATVTNQIDRDRLTQHLEKISCGGQIPGAVLFGAFATQSMTLDQLLVVVAPPLDKVQPLEEEVGIADLKKLIAALRVASGSGNEAKKVRISVNQHRLIIDEDHRGVLRLLTAHPHTIGTQLSTQGVDSLKSRAPTGDGVPLTRSLIEGIKSTFGLFKVEEVELVITPSGGTIRVGNDNADIADFPVPELVGDSEYSLLFGKHLVDVLAIVTNFADARLRYGGPGSLLVVQDGLYQFFLSPRTRPADTKSKTSETEGGEETE